MENKRSEKIKIALVAPSARNLGGQSIQAKCLTEAFTGSETVEMDLIPADPQLKIFGFLQKIKYVRTVFTSLKFWQTLLTRLRKYDIVLVSSADTTGYIISTVPPLLVAKLYGKKVVLNYHSGFAEEHIKHWKWTARPTMKMFDKIVVPSQFLIDVFARFDLRASAVFNFVESERFIFRARSPLKPVFLSNRNFEAYYQVGDVLRAFQIIRQKIPEAKLIVAGYGSQEASLKKLAADLNLENTEFIGRVELADMPKIYDRADIYLNSSVVDNMPLSIIEAFCCGLPVVSTDAGGIPYLIKDGETGLLVETGDYNALAARAIRLFEDENLARKIVENAREESRKYRWETVRNDWLEFYRETNKTSKK